MLRFYFFLLLILFIVLPFSPLRAETTDCDCTITRVTGTTHYSPGCATPKDVCSLTLGKDIGAIDLFEFTDLKGVVVSVAEGTHPNFSADALIDAATYFDISSGGVTLQLFAGADVYATLSGIEAANQFNSVFLQLSAVLCLGVTLRLKHAYNPGLLPCLLNLAPLPVTLLTYEIASAPDGVSLRWSTANETDNDHFRILYSADGTEFAEIGRVLGMGTTGRETFYGYVHKMSTPGTHYYQLEQVDYDGTVTSLGVRSARLAGDPVVGLSVYPNPVSLTSSRLRLSDRPAAGDFAQLYDMSGRQAARLLVAADGSCALPTRLRQGLYLLRYAERQTMVRVVP